MMTPKKRWEKMGELFKEIRISNDDPFVDELGEHYDALEAIRSRTIEELQFREKAVNVKQSGQQSLPWGKSCG